MDDNPVLNPAFWPAFFDAARAAGLLGTLVLGGVWYLERQERRETRKQLDILVERVLPLLERGVQAQEKLGDILTDGHKRR